MGSNNVFTLIFSSFYVGGDLLGVMLQTSHLSATQLKWTPVLEAYRFFKAYSSPDFKLILNLTVFHLHKSFCFFIRGV